MGEVEGGEGREGREDAMLLALKMEKDIMSQGMQVAYRSWKGRKISPLETRENIAPLKAYRNNTVLLPLGLLTFSTVRQYICVVLCH